MLQQIHRKMLPLCKSLESTSQNSKKYPVIQTIHGPLSSILRGTEVRTEHIIKESSLDDSPSPLFLRILTLSRPKSRNARETDRTVNIGSHRGCKVRSLGGIPSESRADETTMT